MNNISEHAPSPTDNDKYVSCENCAMNPVCQPVLSQHKSISLMDHYLNKRIAIKTGEKLFDKDETLSSIYAVCSGSFKRCKTNDNSDNNILGFRFSGELLGEDAIFHKKYNYRVIALEDSAICKVSVDELLNCSTIVPQLQSQLIELLSQQSHVNQQEFNCLVAKRSAESLVASFLLNIMERNRQNTKQTNVISLAMSRDNLANFLGLRRETLSRILSKLQKNELITISGKSIKINNIDKLALLAE